MKGNFQVRFLVGKGGVILPTYPTCKHKCHLFFQYGSSLKNINATPGNSYDGDILIPLIDEMIEQGFMQVKWSEILLIEKLTTGIN